MPARPWRWRYASDACDVSRMADRQAYKMRRQRWRAPLSIGCGDRRDDIVGGDDDAEFGMQRGQVRTMEVGRRNGTAIRAGQVEARGRITDDDGAVAEIRGHARAGRDAHVGGHAEQHDLLHAQATQPQVQVGADEGGIDRLAHQWLVVAWFEARAQPVAGLVWLERRA